MKKKTFLFTLVILLFGITVLSQSAAAQENGTMTDLGTLDGYYSAANAINERGKVVGLGTAGSEDTHAFLWENGAITDLGSLGENFSAAYDINDRGQVVGYSATASWEYHAFLWENGSMTDLGTLSGNFSLANAINARGQIVGNSDQHAFLWEK